MARKPHATENPENPVKPENPGNPDTALEQGSPVPAEIGLRGPYDLAEVATMGFGHRDEQSFDGVMRVAMCVDGDYEQQVGVEVRQSGQRLDLRIHHSPQAGPLDQADVEAVRAQVARVVSADHDGDAFAAMCRADPVLARVHATAPGFRPALFYSPYEAAVWSILSARRARSQGIGLRTRVAHQWGVTFDLAGVPTAAVPTPSRLLTLDAIPGLPADRIPRLHAVAVAGQQGKLSAQRLSGLDPAAAMAELQQLPGIGPFYSALIVLRACGMTDVLPVAESRILDLVRELYALDHDPGDAEFAALAERWRPFRTWAAVLLRAASGRLADR